jgi:ATP-dependent Clp protease ATP-binding subunit ClpX
MNKLDPTECCSFCGKHKDQVKKLIIGETVGICNECVELCGALLTDEGEKTINPTVEDANLDPVSIKDFLDQHVIGQDDAKIMLSVAIVNHYKRINNPPKDLRIDKANVLMLGPTGSGKTLLAKTVAKYLDVPFAIADATSLTEAGYVGDDVESLIVRLYQAADNDIEKTQRGIIFVDEIDKIARKSESTSITRDVSGEGVQQALLKMVEGTKCRIPAGGGRKHPGGDMIEIDTTNILFIAGGAFVGMDNIVKNRVRGTSIGFNSLVNSNVDVNLRDTSPDDLVRFGMIPEFVGRFPNWVSLQPLSQEDLVHILMDVKNSYVEQYQWLFDQDGVVLEFTADALDLIANRTLKTKTGARGLHSELERVLMPHMFKLNRYTGMGIKTVKINPELVNAPIALTGTDVH